MDSKSKYRSSLAFTDLLFNIVLGFAFMFIIAFLLINPVEKDATVESKAEFMIIMEWDDQSAYDVDLWMEDPVGNIVGFPNMNAGLLHLDKDDLGKSNDSVTLRDGTVKQVYLNREVMTIRGIVPGEYIVNNHLYSTKGTQQKGPIDVTTRIIKLNPFGEIHNGQITLRKRGAEETVIRFTIDPTGYVKSKNTLKKRFAGKRPGSGHISSTGATSEFMTTPEADRRHADEFMTTPGSTARPADDDEVHETDSPTAEGQGNSRPRDQYDPIPGGF